MSDLAIEVESRTSALRPASAAWRGAAVEAGEMVALLRASAVSSKSTLLRHLGGPVTAPMPARKTGARVGRTTGAATRPPGARDIIRRQRARWRPSSSSSTWWTGCP